QLEFEHPLDPLKVEEIAWIQEFCSQENLFCKSKVAKQKYERNSGDEYDGTYEITVTTLTVDLP
ncbi:hypothetical protein KW807_02075, partial [Candidatus Parcubacteria bacterium]|nr:hypothetical protein [Candidatus Parcubacteria bacterium]